MANPRNPQALFRAVLLCLIVAPSARAQQLEFGGTAGIGSRGSESALARAEAHVITGVHVSGWWLSRVETGLRMAWLQLPTRIGSATYYYGCETTPEGRCQPAGSLRVLFERTSPRTFIGGHVLYHFRDGRRWRPFAGVAFGGMRDTERGRCETAGCQELLPGLQSVLGSRTSWYADLLSPVAGVSATVAQRVIIRGGIQLHRPFGEELSLLETFAGVGYRF